MEEERLDGVRESLFPWEEREEGVFGLVLSMYFLIIIDFEIVVTSVPLPI